MCYIFNGNYGNIDMDNEIGDIDVDGYFLTLKFKPLDTTKYSFAIYGQGHNNVKLNIHYFETAPFEYTITFHDDDGYAVLIDNVKFGGSLIG